MTDKDFRKVAVFIEELIKTPRPKKQISPDKFLNKTLKIKRIGYSMTAKVLSRTDNQYTVRIISIDTGTTRQPEGDTIVISQRELELTSRPCIKSA